MNVRRMIVFFILVMAMFLPVVLLAATVNLNWNPNSESDLDHYDLYISQESTIYVDSIWNGSENEHSLDLPNGVYYVVLTASDTSDNESDYSEETRFELRDDNLFYVQVQYQQEDDGIRFFLPDTSALDVSGFILYYTKDGITESVDIGTEREYFFFMDEGAYNFHLVPYSVNGDEYNSYSASFNELWPPLEKPELKVEYVGIGLNTLVLAGIKPAEDTRIDYYNYRLSSTYAKAQAGETDIISGYTENRNIVENASSSDYEMVFLSVNPVSGTPGDVENNVVGETVISYVLFGNILGTYNDEVSWDMSDVYYVDYNAFGQNYYSTIVGRPILEEYVYFDLWDYLPFTVQERADCDGDGMVYYIDYNFFGQKYYHFGINYAE
jgi:hypothetical protein